MEINYWIILLIFFLVSRWLRKKKKEEARRGLPRPGSEQQPQPERHGEEQAPESIPKWMKDLGLLDLLQEERSEEAFEEDLQAEEERSLREGLELSDEVAPSEKPPLSESPALDPLQFQLGDEIDSLQESREARRRAKAVPRRVRRDIGRFIRNSQNLQDVIVLREVLGPPRGMDRFRYRRRF